MKRLKPLCVLVIVGLLAANPGVFGSEEGECCQEFKNHCSDVCDVHNDWGGMMYTFCNGLYCNEECLCWDIDPETGMHYGHTDPGGTWCPGCAN